MTGSDIYCSNVIDHQCWKWPKRTGEGGRCRNVWNFVKGLKFKTNFHSKMNVCGRELGGVQPPNNSNPVDHCSLVDINQTQVLSPLPIQYNTSINGAKSLLLRSGTFKHQMSHRKTASLKIIPNITHHGIQRRQTIRTYMKSFPHTQQIETLTHPWQQQKNHTVTGECYSIVTSRRIATSRCNMQHFQR